MLSVSCNIVTALKKQLSLHSFQVKVHFDEMEAAKHIYAPKLCTLSGSFMKYRR